jgi:dTDP-4-dehydrorhamnose reductase
MSIILGSGGMLGSMVKQVLPKTSTLDRPEFDAERLHDFLPGPRMINCIGVIKPYCTDVTRAIKVNALFPHYLPAETIQIATDCVYSGAKGGYVETDPHDAGDVYGQTKSLGEAPQLNNLRCSIIGPEVKNHISLLDWFLSQKGKVDGFTNHRWNGITTYHFALIVKGILSSGIQLPPLQHIVPADIVTKAELLQIIKEEFKHKIKIVPKEATEAIDRTLSTNNPELNLRLWQLAGYEKPPTIRRMIKELAALK